MGTRLTTIFASLVSLVLLDILAIVMQIAPAQAAPGILYVAPSGNCGGGTPNCYGSVQTAVDAASPGDEIRVATGTYADVSVRPRNDFTTTGVVTQVVYISKTLTIRGGYITTNWTTSDPTANPTILDAQGRGRVLYITGAISPTIEGLRITGGNAAGLSGFWRGEDAGGGIYVFNTAATIRNNQVFSNTAPIFGGGLYLYKSATTFSENSVSNNTTNIMGGGLYLDNSSNTILSGNTIANNTSGSGGGLLLDGWLDGTGAKLEGNTIISNTAWWWGGGLRLIYSAATFTNNIIASNTAGFYGGGLLLEESNATLTNNVITDNQSNSGSGLYIYGASPHLLHTTIARNHGGDGSGVYVIECPTVNCEAGAIYSTVVLTNTILVSHTIGITATGGNTVRVNSVLWFGTPITVSLAATATMSIQNQYQGDPAFAPDGYHLTVGSAAIDKGVNTGVTNDIDGQPQPYGATSDLGADEYWPPGTPKYIYFPLIMRNH